VVVGFTDYVIRPRLVGDEGMPAILTFLGLFGGLEVLGLSLLARITQGLLTSMIQGSRGQPIHSTTWMF
jgi:predicted PurR-regulated permease PerM